MGTNYYVHKKPCECCGKADPPLHIGKSSGGWYFALHCIPEEGLVDLDTWIEFLVRSLGEGSVIKNEYEDEVKLGELLEIIVNRRWPGNRTGPDTLDPGFEWGINNLARRTRPATRQTTSVGSPPNLTYDMIEGEFS